LPFSLLIDAQINARRRKIDPNVAYRVQKRSRLIREEVFRKHGLVDIVVPAIRELRGPLP
jgi:hypothetical protein